MKLKETNKFKALAKGVEVILSSKPRPFGPTFTYQGVVDKVKGLNGDCYQVFFTNGRSTYLTWDVKVEVVA